MTPDQYQLINAVIVASPELLALAHKADDVGLANSLNAVGTDTVTLTAMAKNDFLVATANAAVRLAIGKGTDGSDLSALIIAGWQAALQVARAADPGSQINLGVITLLAAELGDPVTTKVMNSGEYAALTSRLGSPVEKVLGAGIVITPEQAGASR